MTTPFPFVAGQVLTAAQLNDIQNLPISDKTASYTLIAGDETKRTMMNNASATTITVNNSIFTVGDVIQIANKGAGTCTITAGAGVTINTSGSLALAQYGGGYLLALSASIFTFFNLGGGVSYGTATGGASSSITVGGINYTLLTFTTDTNLVVTKTGLFDYLMFAGGGGGGRSVSTTEAGGGGGAGGYATGTIYLAAATYAVDIGAGGASMTHGSSSNVGGLGGLSVVGGGNGVFGSTSPTPLAGYATEGGSGGGGSNVSLAPSVQGFAGGPYSSGSSYGGGGGAGAASANNNGGVGFDTNAFTGAGSLFKGGGGGGGRSGTGGSSVGGAGGALSTAGTAAAANTGSGGGGAGDGTNNLAGGAGGSGIIYIRFKV